MFSRHAAEEVRFDKGGVELVETMKQRFGIEPRIDHYTFMLMWWTMDLLGRARMEE
jgi:hypothetical protein